MNYTVLLIDDNLEMADNIADLLELAHYDVVHASNGKIGVELALQNVPDVILCDIMMPELDGYGVFSILSRDPETAAVPFIFLTAKSDASDVRTGMNLGADGYLTKPFDMVDLLKVIEMRLKKSELLKAAFGCRPLDTTSLSSDSKAENEFEGLYKRRMVRSYKKRDLLFMEGQIPNDLYYIAEGRVKTSKTTYDGKEITTGIYCGGDFLGYVALLDDKPYNEQAEVLEDVKIAVIPKIDFLLSIYSSKNMARRFIRLLSNDVDDMENRLLDVAYQSVRQRVASTLLRISQKFVQPNKEEVITVAGKEISEIVGVSRESMNRVLSDFKKEGLITTMGNGFKIVNKTKLEKILY